MCVVDVCNAITLPEWRNVLKTKLFSMLVISFFLLPASFSQADEGSGQWVWLSLLDRKDVAAVENKLYEDECGACHFAYQPGLLPERSWRKLMQGLDDHFGDNAELDVDVYNELLDYITQNAADHSKHKRSVKVMRTLKNNAVPLRISEIPYIQHEHDEIPLRAFKLNSGLRLSRCPACHKKAAQGSYDEDEINIPGVGAWDD